jgi:hypothetical protein
MDWIRIGDILMAHAAGLDENNVVTQVVVISNDYEPNVEQFAVELFGGVWKQTSYNANIRKNYAGIGFTYDEALDAFIPPKCHDEAILNETTAQWICENEEHYVEIS